MDRRWSPEQMTWRRARSRPRRWDITWSSRTFTLPPPVENVFGTITERCGTSQIVNLLGLAVSPSLILTLFPSCLFQTRHQAKAIQRSSFCPRQRRLQASPRISVMAGRRLSTLTPLKEVMRHPPLLPFPISKELSTCHKKHAPTQQPASSVYQFLPTT